MSIHAGTIAPSSVTLPPNLMLCGRTDLHICKVLTPDMLNTVWAWMRLGLERIKAKNAPEARWLPEHVRVEIQKGFLGQSGTECFVAHDYDQVETLHGFLVAYPLIDPFVHLPLSWLVWMANIEFGVLDRVLPEFEQMARERGYLSWRWMTSRKGWARRAERFGARLVEFTIAKELT